MPIIMQVNHVDIMRQGRYTKCCIYVSEQDLLPQIDGFEDAEYMAFDSWEDARRYVTSTPTEPIMQRLGSKNDYPKRDRPAMLPK